MRDGINHNLSIFGNEFEEGLDALACEYGIDCICLGDAILEDIGACGVYLPLDIRSEEDKYQESFDEYIFRYIDGLIIKKAQFNSVLLTRKEIEGLISRNYFKINWNAPNIHKKPVEKGFLYEAIAVNKFCADDISNFGCSLPEISRYC